MTFSSQVQAGDLLENVLHLFDMDFDDLIIEDGENEYVHLVQQALKKCDVSMADGYTLSLHGLARNEAPDYYFYDAANDEHIYFNICRNTILNFD
jgi:hypothetical protein